MEKKEKIRRAVWISYSSVFAVTGIVLMCVNMIYEGLFFLIPAVCSAGIFLSFYADKNNTVFIVFTIIRLLLLITSILVPSLLWYLIEGVKDSVNVFYNFVSAAIDLGAYIISIIFLAILAKSKDNGENINQTEQDKPDEL